MNNLGKIIEPDHVDAINRFLIGGKTGERLTKLKNVIDRLNLITYKHLLDSMNSGELANTPNIGSSTYYAACDLLRCVTNADIKSFKETNQGIPEKSKWKFDPLTGKEINR